MDDGPIQRRATVDSSEANKISARFSIFFGKYWIKKQLIIQSTGSIPKKRPVYITVKSFSTRRAARMGSITSQWKVYIAAAQQGNAIPG